MKNIGHEKFPRFESVNPYRSIVLHLIPRILTNLDRDQDSPTYGCFDRNYWHYKVHDYSSGLMQQCILTLALVYLNPFDGNIYYKSEEIHKYAIAGITFCKKIQNKDGSFDEYWKGESSIPSTAFTLYSVCETCDLLKIEPEKNWIIKAVYFLKKNSEIEALNQEMASIAAICYAAKILNNEEIKQIAEQKFTQFLKKKQPEGWFSEYGGLDISYLTVSLDYLIRYYELCGDNNALETAKQIVDIIKYFIHPDGSIGGEYGTRNTEYFAPYGIEYLKFVYPISRSIIKKLLEYLQQNEFLNLSCDERYYLHYLNHSFTKSMLIYSNLSITEKLPYETCFEKRLGTSNLYIKSNNNYYFVINFDKGGVFKVMDKKTHVMSTDCGYRLKEYNNIFVTEMPSKNKYYIEKNTIGVTCYFYKMAFFQQSTIKLLLLRLFSKFLGNKMIQLIKKNMIFGLKNIKKDAILVRIIAFEPNKISIQDTINIGDNSAILRLSNKLSIRHTASSRFFQINSLCNKIRDEEYTIKKIKTISREIVFSEK